MAGEDVRVHIHQVAACTACIWLGGTWAADRSHVLRLAPSKGRVLPDLRGKLEWYLWWRIRAS